MFSHKADVTTLDLSNHVQLLVSGSADGTVRVWDSVNGQLLFMQDMHPVVCDIHLNIHLSLAAYIYPSCISLRICCRLIIYIFHRRLTVYVSWIRIHVLHQLIVWEMYTYFLYRLVLMGSA